MVLLSLISVIEDEKSIIEGRKGEGASHTLPDIIIMKIADAISL